MAPMGIECQWCQEPAELAEIDMDSLLLPRIQQLWGHIPLLTMAEENLLKRCACMHAAVPLNVVLHRHTAITTCFFFIAAAHAPHSVNHYVKIRRMHAGKLGACVQGN